MNMSVNYHLPQKVEVTAAPTSTGRACVTLMSEYGEQEISLFGTPEQLKQIAESMLLQLEQADPNYPDGQLILTAEYNAEIERRAVS